MPRRGSPMPPSLPALPCAATPAMIEAGVGAFSELAGEASREALVRAVWEAMVSVAPCGPPEARGLGER